MSETTLQKSSSSPETSGAAITSQEKNTVTFPSFLDDAQRELERRENTHGE
ncbi:hypothetical protein [Gimesia maris]|uniref:hypothetical protein n=1 Tax=Gimesia maris TaxID=122 RepID=UPI0032EB4D63